MKLYGMSKATKRKHVTREVLEDFVVPTGEQTVVKVLVYVTYIQHFWTPILVYRSYVARATIYTRWRHHLGNICWLVCQRSSEEMSG